MTTYRVLKEILVIEHTDVEARSPSEAVQIVQGQWEKDLTDGKIPFNHILEDVYVEEGEDDPGE